STGWRSPRQPCERQTRRNGCGPSPDARLNPRDCSPECTRVHSRERLERSTPMPALRTITEIAPLVRAGAVPPVTLVNGCLSVIEARPDVNAFITVLRESALEDAARAEADIRDGRYKGSLHGIPIAVKDLIHIAGVRTTSGSALPSTEASSDAPVIRRLREAGAILIGKTNLHEFAFGTTSEESAYGPVRNPLDETRSAGGWRGGADAAP